MQGFDYEKARIDLEIPDNFDVVAMIAIGKKDQDNLPFIVATSCFRLPKNLNRNHQKNFVTNGYYHQNYHCQFKRRE